jgi:hypothetical protein
MGIGLIIFEKRAVVKKNYIILIWNIFNFFFNYAKYKQVYCTG